MEGGAYLIGALESSPVFWSWMKDKLAKRGKSVGFAMLNYSALQSYESVLFLVTLTATQSSYSGPNIPDAT